MNLQLEKALRSAKGNVEAEGYKVNDELVESVREKIKKTREDETK